MSAGRLLWCRRSLQSSSECTAYFGCSSSAPELEVYAAMLGPAPALSRTSTIPATHRKLKVAPGMPEALAARQCTES
eukprot:2990741-Rhodomonas_salina.2